MAAGQAVTKDTVNAQTGSVVVQFFDTMDRVVQVKEFLDATPDADLVGLGFTSGDVANIKSAFTDLAAVRAVFLGTASATQSDRTVFAKRLRGIATY